MNETQYLRGTPADRAEIVDFANYVFSQAHRPHDFKQLIPKAYADDVQGIERWHFIAKKNGRICAMVANRPMGMRVLDTWLKCGFIGTVSVHPYARSEGHMKQLMANMLEDARDRYDILVLGGQRQRYNYFGFDHAGANIAYSINTTGIRHCLGNTGVEDIAFQPLHQATEEELDFLLSLMNQQGICGERPRELLLAIMHTWNQPAFLIRIGGELAGYVVGTVGELGLVDEKNLPRVLKAYLGMLRIHEVELMVSPWEKERIGVLDSLYEGRRICAGEMIRVMHWVPVVQAFLKLKAVTSRLEDGERTICVEGEETFTIRVLAGVPEVIPAQGPTDVTLSHMAAQRLLFGMEAALLDSSILPASWLPLPFYLSNLDTF